MRCLGEFVLTVLLMFPCFVKSFSKVSFHRLSSKTVSFHSKRCVKMSSTLSGNLVTVQDCIAAHEINGGKGTIFVDGSWHLSKDRDGRKEYEAGPRITGAKFFDIDDVAAKGSELNPKGLPHMMPPKVCNSCYQVFLSSSLTVLGRKSVGKVFSL